MKPVEYLGWFYNGPVISFGMPVTDRWSAKTYAPTKEKALNNLKFRFKQMYGYSKNAKIDLPGKLTLE